MSLQASSFSKSKYIITLSIVIIILCLYLAMNRRRMSRRKSRPWLSSTLMDFKQEVKEMKAKATQAQEREKVAERTVTLDDVKGRSIHIHTQS